LDKKGQTNVKIKGVISSDCLFQETAVIWQYNLKSNGKIPLKLLEEFIFRHCFKKLAFQI